MNYSSVLVTFPDRNCAKELSMAAVKERLAACANMFDVESIYRWENEIQEETETAALFKIRSDDFQKFHDFICSMHPYEVPCIVRYDIAEGHAPYLDWIKESTNQH